MTSGWPVSWTQAVRGSLHPDLSLEYTWVHYVDDTILTCEGLHLPQDPAGFAGTSTRQKIGVNPQKIRSPGTAIKLLRVFWLNRTQVVQEAKDKLQTYATPKNVKEVQISVGTLGFWKTFIPHQAQCLHPLYHLVKKRYKQDWWSEQQATFEKTKILVKQIKALGTSQAGLPSELDDFDFIKYELGTVVETTEGESAPRILFPALEGSRNPTYSHRATGPSSVHSAPLGRASPGGTAYHGKNLPSC